MILLLAACEGDGERPTPPGPDGPPTLLAESAGAITVAWPDLAFAPDGTLWVSWVEIDGDDVSDIFVARSSDAGRTFSPKTRVDDVDTLFLGTVRQPVLAVDDERVAITVGGGTYLESTILLYVASVGQGEPVFEGRALDEASLLVGTGGSDLTLVDQPELAFDPTGELWLNWKQGTRNESFQLALARESEGYAVARLEDEARGQPCECCPTDFLMSASGQVLLAFRNNDLNLREIWVTELSPEARSAQVSNTGWEIGGCPFDGPMLTEAADGALLATWADASEGDSYQWLAVSQDRGRTWTDSFRVEPTNEESVTWPTVVTGPDGAVYTSVVEIYHQTNLHVTEDLGATFAALPAEAPTGPLFWSELAAGPDGVGLVGVTEGGELWYLAVADAG